MCGLSNKLASDAVQWLEDKYALQQQLSVFSVGTSPANHPIHIIYVCRHIFGILFLCGAARMECSDCKFLWCGAVCGQNLSGMGAVQCSKSVLATSLIAVIGLGWTTYELLWSVDLTSYRFQLFLACEYFTDCFLDVIGWSRDCDTLVLNQMLLHALFVTEKFIWK